MMTLDSIGTGMPCNYVHGYQLCFLNDGLLSLPYSRICLKSKRRSSLQINCNHLLIVLMLIQPNNFEIDAILSLLSEHFMQKQWNFVMMTPGTIVCKDNAACTALWYLKSFRILFHVSHLLILSLFNFYKSDSSSLFHG